MSIYDAAMKYQDEGVPLVVIAGNEYGTGSSRDWAAKGTLLLGVRAVIAESFERIHRSNLVGMGVLPLQFMPARRASRSASPATRRSTSTASRDEPGAGRKLERDAHGARAATRRSRCSCASIRRNEVDYYRHGGILPYVLRQLIA